VIVLSSGVSPRGILQPGGAHRRLAASLPAVLSLSLALAGVSGPAGAEIFKCTARRAMPTYQNFPCEFESLGAAPASAAPGIGPRAPTIEAAARTVHATRHGGARTPASAASPVPSVGMTTEEVKAVWGEPIDTTREEYVRGDIETWTYADSRSIRFDTKGRVAEIKW
jgi:hypothetical protein